MFSKMLQRMKPYLRTENLLKESMSRLNKQGKINTYALLLRPRAKSKGHSNVLFKPYPLNSKFLPS